MKEYFIVCMNGEQISPIFNTNKEASNWAINAGYDVADDRISISTIWE